MTEVRLREEWYGYCPDCGGGYASEDGYLSLRTTLPEARRKAVLHRKKTRLLPCLKLGSHRARAISQAPPIKSF